ncbi:MAG: AraC family transcriptional regulator [Acetobacter sp.]|nr:AraC family transcriptional regulator [Bacteroides sp.]MCM1341716.1 AraC family transcriptional regulator [Acetobacter sp.]MCM1432345.1 AraC family transcriptional regulator [Clostridiales bacterium]
MLFEIKHSNDNHYSAISIDSINCVPHCHTSYELLFVMYGKIKAVVGGIDYTVSKNECIMIQPMQVHSYSTVKDNQVKISIFSSDYIYDFHNEIRGSILSNPVISFDFNDINLLQSSYDRYEIKSVLYKYCSSLIKNGVNLSNQNSNELLVKIVNYIQCNFKNKLSLKKISDEFGYSYNYLSSFFRTNFECGFSEYVNKFRLTEAIRLLKKTDMPITEIAFESGFASIRNFNDVFKTEYNISPSKFRKTI